MEIIRNYLDSMFANLPNNPAVIKAKDELWQIMEDKYNELMSEGKSENEAVGTIISEFGNLSELAEALGLEDEIKESIEDLAGQTDEAGNAETKEDGKADTDQQDVKINVDEKARIIHTDEAEELLKYRADSSLKISLGIAICIVSLVGPILTDMFFNQSFQFIGAILMALIAGVGAVVIVLGATPEKSFSAVGEEKCTLSMEATKFVAGERAAYGRNHTLRLTLGIMLTVLSWIPPVIFGEVLPKFENLSGAVFFIAVALGVMLIVYTSMRMNSYNKLLSFNGKGTMKAEYVPEEEDVKYINKTVEFFMSVYWPTVTCIYLILSFTTFYWGLTWIIWPVTGILYRPLKRALTVKE